MIFNAGKIVSEESLSRPAKENKYVDINYDEEEPQE